MNLLTRTLPSFQRLSKRCFASKIQPPDPLQLSSLLTPYLDFTVESLKSPYLRSNLDARGKDIDTSDLPTLWETYNRFAEIIETLDNYKASIAKMMKECQSPKDDEKIQVLKNKGKTVRENIKDVEEGLRSLEALLLPRLLKIPNALSIRCSDTGSVLEEFGDRKPGVHHLETDDNVYYVNPRTYFLKNDAFLLELDIVKSCCNVFNSDGFIPMSNPNFSRGLISQYTDKGITIELKSGDSFNGLFLAGGASMNSFCALHAKKIVHREHLPLRYTTHSAIYEPKEPHKYGGLYEAWQSKGARVFILSEDDSKLHFDKVLKKSIAWFKKLGLPFRAVYIPIKEMDDSEMLRASFQVFSPFNGDFVEVGHLSYYSSFLSKRLRMYYQDEKELKFLNCTSGLIVNTAPLLACLFESKADLKALRSSLSVTS